MKKNTVLSGVLALLLCLGACGGSTEEEDVTGVGRGTPSAEPTPKVEVTPTPTPTPLPTPRLGITGKEVWEGSDEAETVIFSFGGLDFSIPDYYAMEIQSDGSMIYSYQDNGEMVGGIICCEEAVGTEEEFNEVKTELISDVINSYNNETRFLNAEEISPAGLSGIAFTYEVETNSKDGFVTHQVVFVYNDFIDKCIMCMFGQPPRVQYDYFEDFDKIIESVMLAEESYDSDSTSEPEPEPTPVSGIRPEFKEALDSYEAFFYEYVEFMQRYANSSNPYQLMAEYMDFMNQYLETMDLLDALENEDMTREESLYYSEVMFRISAKLMEVSGSLY